ncbi:hypothetical protein PR202_ga10360 [Eleusine coracana subsp. coracana]|uniref:AAA+ ATPase At3g28540-like C-terminal domain-containing protein n=1 Tax=Eleusine coracana subsp. coracana TaxID=191504 RepID=A0AAV5C6F9_ELECO|nr:hypothetical protein PR202_ga10360 [Eleusine coracana subsp. coracana]
MDVHVHMGYCGFGAFKELAATYHGVDGDEGHPLFPEIEALLREVDAAPAEVAREAARHGRRRRRGRDGREDAEEIGRRVTRRMAAGTLSRGCMLHVGPRRPVPAPSRGPSSARRMVIDEAMLRGTGRRGRGGLRGRGRR